MVAVLRDIGRRPIRRDLSALSRPPTVTPIQAARRRPSTASRPCHIRGGTPVEWVRGVLCGLSQKTATQPVVVPAAILAQVQPP
jgi:hypothetical protein